MEIVECKNNIKCEIGACRNRAAFAIKPERVGVRGRVYMCEKCMGEIYAAMGEKLVPKSIETAKKRSARGVKKNEA